MKIISRIGALSILMLSVAGYASALSKAAVRSDLKPFLNLIDITNYIVIVLIVLVIFPYYFFKKAIETNLSKFILIKKIFKLCSLFSLGSIVLIFVSQIVNFFYFYKDKELRFLYFYGTFHPSYIKDLFYNPLVIIFYNFIEIFALLLIFSGIEIGIAKITRKKVLFFLLFTLSLLILAVLGWFYFN